MNRIQVEARVIELVARALRGEGVEDSQVELKSDWPDDIPKTARLIAAHLNASHGEPILWIFGVNEKEAKLVPRTQVELANWWPQIQKNYDQLPPSLVMDMEVAVEGGSVSAIVISSEEAPFVIKSPASGIIQREVPWREGRNTRSARRSDLLRMLAPRVQLPEVEVLSAQVLLHPAKGTTPDDEAGPRVEMFFRVILYVEPPAGSVVAFPRHRSQVELSFDGQARPLRMIDEPLRPEKVARHNAPATTIIDAPQRAVLGCPITFKSEYAKEWAAARSILLVVKVMPAGAQVPVVARVTAELDPSPKMLVHGYDDHTAVWSYRRPHLVM